MIASDERKFTWRGQVATIRVFRNDGYCWGRVQIVNGGKQYDVSTGKDIYDLDDETALDLLVRASRDPENVEEASYWL